MHFQRGQHSRLNHSLNDSEAVRSGLLDFGHRPLRRLQLARDIQHLIQYKKLLCMIILRGYSVKCRARTRMYDARIFSKPKSLWMLAVEAKTSEATVVCTAATIATNSKQALVSIAAAPGMQRPLQRTVMLQEAVSQFAKYGKQRWCQAGFHQCPLVLMKETPRQRNARAWRSRGESIYCRSSP